MAVPSTKSSSLGRSNPNSRASELTDPMRRSFAANPFAKPSFIPDPNPRTTPPGFPRRNSVGGGREGAAARSFFRDPDNKENGKDPNLKQWKARPPAVSSNGEKNFMSPTVSTSSKVTVSPRKKVLVDRNEPARASAPSAATKSLIRKVPFAEQLHYSCDMKAEGGVGLKKFEALSSLDDGVRKEEWHNDPSSLSCEELCGEPVHNINFDSKMVEESSLATVIDEPDCINLDPSFKISPAPTTPLPVSSGSCILAPLDADPSMPPPYDPKTNYLSPRPQFLHYRPKQRIEPDVSLMSGSFSDTEVTDEDTQPEGSQNESENLSSDERIEEERSPLLVEEALEAKEKAKPSLFSKWKAGIALLLLLSVAFISISGINSPMMDFTVFQDAYQFYGSSEFSEFVKAHFDGLSRNFRTCFTKSLSSISVPSLGHLHYCNLSVLYEYNAVDQGPMFGYGKKDIGEATQMHPQVLNDEGSDAATTTETNENVGGVSVDHYDSDYEEKIKQYLEVIMAVEQASDDAPEFDEVTEGQPAGVMDLDQALQVAGVSEPVHSDVNIDLKVRSSLDSEAADIHIEVSNADAKWQQDNTPSNVGLQDQPGLDLEVAEILTEAYGDNDRKLNEENGEFISMDAATESNEQRLTFDLQLDMVFYLLLCGGSIFIGGAALNWLRQCKSRSTRVNTSSVEQPLFAKAIYANTLLTPNQKLICIDQKLICIDKPSLRNGPTEIDMHGESCPSEMSSIQKGSSSYRQRLVNELNNEVESHEKKAKKRRESTASSSDYSMGSPSYGSFTTYEKIQIKNGHGNGEIVTPVRRSSRIRSQATSPL